MINRLLAMFRPNMTLSEAWEWMMTAGGKRGVIYQLPAGASLNVFFHPDIPADAKIDSVYAEDNHLLVKCFHPSYEIVEEGAKYPRIVL